MKENFCVSEVASSLANKKYFSSFFYYVLKKTLTEEGKGSKVVKRKDYVLQEREIK